MFYGIVGVSGLAFACAMELVPDINQQMKLVPFSDEFKSKMTAVMVVDYVACFVIEKLLKRFFSDFRPRDIAQRRPDQLRREMDRKKIEQAKKDEEEEVKRLEKVAEFERKVEERRKKIEAWRTGRQQN